MTLQEALEVVVRWLQSGEWRDKEPDEETRLAIDKVVRFSNVRDLTKDLDELREAQSAEA